MNAQRFHKEVMSELEQEETKLPALYQLAAEYRQAQTALIDLDLDEQTIADTLEGLSGTLEAKATNVGFMIRNLEGLAFQIKEAEVQMATRRKAIENRADAIREYLLTNMVACGINKIESPYFALTVRKNPAKVIIDDAGAIPNDLYRYPDAPPPEPDKKAIKAAIESGVQVFGAHLEQGVSLQIK